MWLKERQQILIVCTAVLMTVGFVFLRYVPLKRKVAAVELRYHQAHNDITEAAVHRQQLPQLKRQLSELRESCGNYEERIPSERELGVFLHTIARLMNKHNLKEQLIQPGTEAGSGDLKLIPINMQCRGKLSEIFEFYESLKGLDRLVRIEGVSLSNDKDFTGNIKMQMKAAVYYRPESEQG